MFPSQDLSSPVDYVASLDLLVDEFVTAALALGTHPGECEAYGAESLLSDGFFGKHGKSGLCMWYLFPDELQDCQHQ